MKRFFSAFLVLLIIQTALLSCAGGGLAYPDTTTAALTEKEPGAPVYIEAYASADKDKLNANYENEPHWNSANGGIRISNGGAAVYMYIWDYYGLPEGFNFVYLNKLSGTAELTVLCGDPLCDHKKNSECVFYGASMLMYYGGRIFCYKNDPKAYDPAYGMSMSCLIFSTDPQGQDYREYTSFYGQDYSGTCQGYKGKLYFMPPDENYEKSDIISIDIETGKRDRLDIGARDSIYSFFIADDTIYVSQNENGLCAYNLDGSLKEKISEDRFTVCYKYGDCLYSESQSSKLSLPDKKLEPLNRVIYGFYEDHYWFVEDFAIYRASLTDQDAEATLVFNDFPDDIKHIDSIVEIDGLLYISYTIPSEFQGARSETGVFALYDPGRDALYTLFQKN